MDNILIPVYALRDRFMRILFLSNYFPPEVNAPATRLYEHAKRWVLDGHDLEVLTSAPNFPEGHIYEGYENRFSREIVDGINVTRVPMFVTENKGTLRRTLSYLSFMTSAYWHINRVQKPDIVVATSPQFFAAVAGYFAARRFRVPFVLEIRDLWPESIVAVGAVKRNAIIRLFERIEHFLYRKADHIIVVTRSFKRFIAAKDIDAQKISVLKNGADLDTWNAPLESGKMSDLRMQYDLDDRFVVSYIGTIGMAHRADILLEAAQSCQDPDVVFMVVGAGAKRAALEERTKELKLSNFRLLGKVSKDEVRYILALTDISVVHLKKSALFKTVIPSKIFEAMATQTPIILGVEGEARDIILEANAGLPIEPENADELVQAVLRLKGDKDLYYSMAQSGFEHVHKHYDRGRLARQYAALLMQIISTQNPEMQSIKKTIERE